MGIFLGGEVDPYIPPPTVWWLIANRNTQSDGGYLSLWLARYPQIARTATSQLYTHIRDSDH